LWKFSAAALTYGLTVTARLGSGTAVTEVGLKVGVSLGVSVTVGLGVFVGTSVGVGV
jgi:hypothetical protein